MTYSCLMLPFPPSVNSIIKCYSSRRVKTDAHTRYMTEACKALQVQPRTRYTAPVSVVASFGRPDNRKRDLDNHFKAVGDALQANQVLKDDSLIHRLTLQWDEDVTGVRVEIEEMSA